ncbi:MAG: ribosome maturation factor RimP [Firmicutes bacterium]|nr:ribosome maturation factor RimP [Bacillota bacterium]
MHPQEIAARVEQILESMLAGSGLEVVRIVYEKQGQRWFLRVALDRPDGTVDLDDCSRVSDQLGARLDQEDFIPHRYYLEVSSAGLERPLQRDRDFSRAVGKKVDVRLTLNHQGRRHLCGQLLDASPEVLTIQEGETVYTVPRQLVQRAHLVYEPQQEGK